MPRDCSGYPSDILVHVPNSAATVTSEEIRNSDPYTPIFRQLGTSNLQSTRIGSNDTIDNSVGLQQSEKSAYEDRIKRLEQQVENLTKQNSSESPKLTLRSDCIPEFCPENENLSAAKYSRPDFNADATEQTVSSDTNSDSDIPLARLLKKSETLVERSEETEKGAANWKNKGKDFCCLFP
ncbi:unnamed protein product [Acanthoscelides obtectus]|uniref:Uncharacterized protein n=1 Tax=Acanthoscelides obtectus TaxID=200917 RepID=A0A9P0P9E5_ACAOB|nr:unnamed protein product [Acanthoscelides obtectus]CAK1646315.1 hypothetical protein AOBTE_LOCUS14581 [Acanthoscelides obtectus]